MSSFFSSSASVAPRTALRQVGLVTVLTLVLAGPALSAAAVTVPGPTVDLRVDANRDGVVELTGGGAGSAAATSADERGEDTPSALFLPNLDDDTDRCAERTAAGALLTDPELNSCNDAADEVVNGAADVRDLAPLRTVPAPDVADDATGSLTLDQVGRATVFVRRGTTWSVVTPQTRFAAAELRAGLDLGVEGRDIVRDRAVWDGAITVTLTVTSQGVTATDSARLRVAPLLTHTHLQRTRQVLVAGPSIGGATQRVFNTALRRAVAAAGVRGGVREMTGEEFGDRWVQDYVEPMYASIPGPDGVRSIRLLLRSDQSRDGGSALYQLRGRDVGVIWPGPDAADGTRNSFGNLETIPPYTYRGTSYPAGRIVYGTEPARAGADNLSARMLTLLRAQGMQAPLALDTSFLAVGHVDEMMQFLPAKTPRGWRLAVTDPRAGIALLRKAKAAGRGKALVVQKSGETTTTVDAALRPGNAGIVADNLHAAKIIDANVARIKAATGITNADVVRVPGLYVTVLRDAPAARSVTPSRSSRPVGGDIITSAGGRTARPAPKGTAPLARGTAAPKPPAVLVAALVPGAINGIVLGRTVVVPAQFGVRVAGRDIFTDAVRSAYRSAGMTPLFIDGWLYHQGLGEVHCGTNTLRDTSIPWWR